MACQVPGGGQTSPGSQPPGQPPTPHAGTCSFPALQPGGQGFCSHPRPPFKHFQSRGHPGSHRLWVQPQRSPGMRSEAEEHSSPPPTPRQQKRGSCLTHFWLMRVPAFWHVSRAAALTRGCSHGLRPTVEQGKQGRPLNELRWGERFLAKQDSTQSPSRVPPPAIPGSASGGGACPYSRVAVLSYAGPA